MKYQTPPVYFTIHILMGFFSYYYPLFIPVFLSYQFLQYFTNSRLFLLSTTIERGNSFEYTLYKCTQFLVGYLIAFLYNLYNTKYKIGVNL